MRRLFVLSVLLGATACTEGDECLSLPLTRIEPIAAGVACEYGGTLVHAGGDRDCSGILDNLEITHTTVVCTENPSGPISLVRVDSVAAGGRCETGGSVVRSGIDDDANGMLDPEEVDSEAFVCNGTSPEQALKTCDGADSVYEGTVVVLADSSLDVLDDVTCVDGNIIINSGSLSTLQRLSSLTKVTGDLLVVGSGRITSLDGLANLAFVGGVLMVQNNNQLVDLRGLQSLRDFGTLRIVGNSLMTTLLGLEGLVEVSGSIEINGVPNVTSLRGLENLRSAGELRIQNNDALTDVSALDGLQRTTGGFALVSNDSLVEASFANLQRVDGVFDVFEHSALQTVSLPALLLIAGPMRIRDNQALLVFDAPAVTTGTSFEAITNPALTSVTMPSIVYLAGGLRFTATPNLSFAHFPALSTVAGAVQFRDVDQITGFGGLARVETMGSLAVRECPGLVDLSGLENVVAISGNVVIRDNPSLTSVSELSSLERIAGALEITGNVSLPTSAAQELGNQVEVGDDVTISGNGPG